jgi:SAM-dependent methyltransferase
MKLLLDLLREPTLRELDVDAEERLEFHRAILRRKRILSSVFADNHRLFKKMADQWLPAVGMEIELGGGSAAMRESYPEVLATDIVPGKHLDLVLNAERMDLPNESVRVFYCQNCFHHFSYPGQFFSELERTLVPAGGVVILDPYYGPLASFLHKRMFTTEGFDKNYPTWETPVAGPMSGANQALSYIVFVRDRARFQREHPSLRVVHQETVGSYLRYVVSGGLNFRQLLPNWSTGAVRLMETLTSPLSRWLAVHHVIVIRKDRK